ncbi:MAG: cell division protein FtsQ/DivIB [Solirubrobacterales bacterium]
MAVAVVVLAAGYRFWLRDSSLVAVDQVEVKGVTANQAEVTASLEQAGTQMTTLHIDDEKLRDAVSRFPTVASIRADATLPDKLTVTVTERLPVAVVKVEGEPTAVAADGLLLPGISVRGERLPTIEAAAVSGGQLDEEGAAQAAILGAAPAEVREEIEAIAWDPARGGVVVALDGAPEARFGDGSQAESKWRALAAVLADPDLGASAYVDVSVPGRAVSGG